jgi:hypothetical protein
VSDWSLKITASPVDAGGVWLRLEGGLGLANSDRLLVAVGAVLADADVERIEIDCSELDRLTPDGTHVLFEVAELCHAHKVAIDVRMGRHGRILSPDTFREAVGQPEVQAGLISALEGYRLAARAAAESSVLAVRRATRRQPRGG